VFVPQEHAPGAEAEVDFGEVYVVLNGVKTKCHMFIFRLSHSPLPEDIGRPVERPDVRDELKPREGIIVCYEIQLGFHWKIFEVYGHFVLFCCSPPDVHRMVASGPDSAGFAARARRSKTVVID
jgi:hypothetical protein